MQRLLFKVDPFGERRDDYRAAWNAAIQIIASAPGEVSPDDAQAKFEELRTYLKCHKPEDAESIYDATALEKMKNETSG